MRSKVGCSGCEKSLKPQPRPTPQPRLRVRAPCVLTLKDGACPKLWRRLARPNRTTSGPDESCRSSQSWRSSSLRLWPGSFRKCRRNDPGTRIPLRYASRERIHPERNRSAEKTLSGNSTGTVVIIYIFVHNNGRKTNAAGISASPLEGAFGAVDGGAACECASRVAARHAADTINGSQGG
jgi:hypothetical protein